MSFRISSWASPCLATYLLAATLVAARAEPPQFAEPLELFHPRQPATEVDADRAEALTYYGMARESLSRGDASKALQWFQRTLRYDPSCVAAARSAMRLALQLERPAEAVAPALLLSECDDADRRPLRYLALYLTRQGRWQDAIKLYERTLGEDLHTPASEEDVLMMMEMARLCHVIKDDERAADYFTEVLKALDSPRKHNLSPKAKKEILGEDAAAYQLIGQCFLAAGRVEAAEAVFKKAEEEAPDANRAAFNNASIHFHSKRFQEALGDLKACVENQTGEKTLEVYRLLEQTMEKLGRGNELVEYLTTIHEKQPDNTALGYYLAERLFEAKAYDRAEQLFAALVDKAPTSTAYQRLLAIYLDRSDYEKVSDVLATVVSKTGTLDALGESLGRVIDSSEAVDAILARGEASLASNDDATNSVLLAAALIALEAERFDSAEPLMTAAIAAFPDRAENLRLVWGLDLLSADRHADAVRVLRDGAETKGLSDDRRAMFDYYLAAAQELDGQTDVAVETAREAVKLSEDSAPFHVRLAWVLYHADRKSEAAAQYRAVIDRFGDDYKSEQVRITLRQARMVLSTLCVSEHRVEDAVEWLEQVLDEFPDDPGALNDLGYLWADENQHIDRAYRMIERAVKADPENAAYRDSLGWILFRKGRYEEAVTELAKAAEMEPDPVVLEHLGDACAKMKQTDKAKESWEKAAAKFEEAGQDSAAAKVRAKLADGK